MSDQPIPVESSVEPQALVVAAKPQPAGFGGLPEWVRAVQTEIPAKVAAAYVAAQAELKAAELDSTNPFLRNRYASLASVISESRPVLAKHGLSVIQIPTNDAEEVFVSTSILHSSGERIDCGSMHLSIGDEKGKSRAQVLGSIVTYLRRYAWACALGIYAGDDDDAPEPPKKLPATPRQHPEPKVTESPIPDARFRLKALNVMGAAPGQPNRKSVEFFLRSKGWITLEQQAEDWPLEHVPASKEAFDALQEEYAAQVQKLTTDIP
jgi:hypothetical protein